MRSSFMFTVPFIARTMDFYDVRKNVMYYSEKCKLVIRMHPIGDKRLLLHGVGRLALFGRTWVVWQWVAKEVIRQWRQI